jgi:hypothetical protein
VRALLAHRDARLDLADQALSTVDYRLLLATMAVVIVVAAAAWPASPGPGKAREAAPCRPRVTGNRGCR